jgi:hypothetical protein
MVSNGFSEETPKQKEKKTQQRAVELRSLDMNWILRVEFCNN